MITLLAPASYEEEIKKSRFIAKASRADNPEQAQAFLESVKEPEANHNCWAYRIGEKYRFSDDGEPGGTAGRPILAALEGQGIDHAMVVVIRYFGGIKLGAGGLVRAYGGAASNCLRLAPKLEVRPSVLVRLWVPFSDTGVLYPLLDRFQLVKETEQYQADGLELCVRLEESLLDGFRQRLTDATRGRARLLLPEKKG